MMMIEYWLNRRRRFRSSARDTHATIRSARPGRRGRRIAASAITAIWQAHCFLHFRGRVPFLARRERVFTADDFAPAALSRPAGEVGADTGSFARLTDFDGATGASPVNDFDDVRHRSICPSIYFARSILWSSAGFSWRCFISASAMTRMPIDYDTITFRATRRRRSACLISRRPLEHVIWYETLPPRGSGLSADESPRRHYSGATCPVGSAVTPDRRRPVGLIPPTTRPRAPLPPIESLWPRRHRARVIARGGCGGASGGHRSLVGARPAAALVISICRCLFRYHSP